MTEHILFILGLKRITCSLITGLKCLCLKGEMSADVDDNVCLFCFTEMFELSCVVEQV